MILVTGATGFLGRNLIPRLCANGESVRALVRPSSDVTFLQQHGVELAFAADISDRDAVTTAAEGCRIVIHAAGHFRMWGPLAEFWRVNVAGTAAALDAAAAAGVERFVYVSTIAVIGDTGAVDCIDEHTPCKPLDHYQRTKLEAERLVLAYHRSGSVPAVVVRPGAMYGPWGRYAFNRLFFEEPLRGWRIKVRQGRHVTFPVFAPDVVDGLVLALKHGRPGEIYNISGRSLAHHEIYDTVSEIAGISAWRMNVPVPAVLLLARLWTTLARFTGWEPFYPLNLATYVFQDWRVTSAKARRELGFTPTPFAEGARETVRWYHESGVL